MESKVKSVALTGGTGFVGRHVLPHLLASGYDVRVLVRDLARLHPPADVDRSRITPVQGSLFDDDALAELVQGADAVVHLVGIIMESPSKGQTFERVHTQATQRLVKAAKDAGSVKRWIHMSALGARHNAVADYHRTKYEAEQAVRESGLDMTIFRPSIIHGADGEFMSMVKHFWCDLFNPPLPVPSARPPFVRMGVPYFGAGLLGFGGAGRLQPVYVEDVAKCFAKALGNDRTIGETYPMGGPDIYTWPDLYATVKQYLKGAWDKEIWPLPAWYAKLLTVLPGLPFNRDQVVMSQEDSICDITKVQQIFDIELAPFEPTLAEYAGEIQ